MHYDLHVPLGPELPAVVSMLIKFGWVHSPKPITFFFLSGDSLEMLKTSRLNFAVPPPILYFITI